MAVFGGAAAWAQGREPAALMGLPGSALKPGESVTTSQGLPEITLTLGKDFKGAGVSFSAPRKQPKVDDKTTANEVKCASGVQRRRGCLCSRSCRARHRQRHGRLTRTGCR